MSRKQVLHNGRLACFYEKEEHDWNRHWETNLAPSIYRQEKNPGMGELDFLRDHLPPMGKILEAGCGTGVYVWDLLQNGFDCEGIDNATETIERVLQVMPGLPVSSGNVLRIERPDNYYAGFLSLGVIEHREAGPEPFIAEMTRVIMPNGIAIVAFPFMNRFRRLKRSCGRYPRGIPRGSFFYQYYLEKAEIVPLLHRYGFHLVHAYSYDVASCINDDILSSRLPGRLLAKRIVEALANKSKLLHDFFAHGCALVCRKQNPEGGVRKMHAPSTSC